MSAEFRPIFSQVIIVLALTVMSLAIYSYRHKTITIPVYVSDAQKDLNNFLQYTFGPGRCNSEPGNLGEWYINCYYAHTRLTYQVSMRSDGSYVLFAHNLNAEKSASEGLTRYLGIITLKDVVSK